ncbi:MAG: type II toxin-antitoxin system VapC family toxin [Campylobacterota bacterium]|nr:type II toxin-antitoxin system VapC family toxin [Campylobacterota bacterium]
MLYMLDTNICGYIIRDKPEYIKEKFKAVESEHDIALSSIVVSELLYGAKKKDSDKLTRVVNSFINNFTILDFDKSASNEYADIRVYLERSGNIIGSNDLFIASHAKAKGAVLVTNNTKEFVRVKDLSIENWII